MTVFLTGSNEEADGKSMCETVASSARMSVAPAFKRQLFSFWIWEGEGEHVQWGLRWSIQWELSQWGWNASIQSRTRWRALSRGWIAGPSEGGGVILLGGTPWGQGQEPRRKFASPLLVMVDGEAWCCSWRGRSRWEMGMGLYCTWV